MKTLTIKATSMTPLTNEHINSLIEAQLMEWPEAAANFRRLAEIERRPLPTGDLESAVQLNPARIRSTGAKVDSASIKSRPCFLCRSNRPAEQISMPWMEGWELLVNPFPILPVHFTIVDRRHVPQGRIPFEMAAMAENAPGLAFFYNGARAGASAPDHRHAQAVLKSELPLMRLVEKVHPVSLTGWKSSEEFGVDVPFHFMSAVVTPDESGMRTLAKCAGAFGIDGETGMSDIGLLNAFMWMDEAGLLRIVIVPRKAHRPRCFFQEEGKKKMISPGAIDMAGLIITPREEDFRALDEASLREIYSDVAFAESLPEQIPDYFKTT